MNGKSNSQFLLWAKSANNMHSLNTVALRSRKPMDQLLELLLAFISRSSKWDPTLPKNSLMGHDVRLTGLCEAVVAMSFKGIINWQDAHVLKLYIQYFAKRKIMERPRTQYAWIPFLKWPRQAWLKKHIKWQKELSLLQE